MKRFISVIAAVLICTPSFCFSLREIAIFSDCMKKEIPVTVILPQQYEKEVDFPVVYILHGWSDNPDTWAKHPEIGMMADFYGIIMVMPDGGYDSWYFDSPYDGRNKYETFITRELIPVVDSEYKTRPSRDFRAITGNSMGGHGALYLGIRHQDLFANIGSMSGGVDIRPFPNEWGISKWLGPKDKYPNNWEDYTVTNMLDRLGARGTNIIFDCGTEDFFYEVNMTMHEKMLKMAIPHEFISRPGGHDWKYWRNAIQHQVLFFFNNFQKGLR